MPLPSDLTPWIPSYEQVMPEGIFDKIIAGYGTRLGWMQGHVCACTMASGHRGSAQPQCLTCQGRGVWWTKPWTEFVGMLTYAPSVVNPDEPGVTVDPTLGNFMTAAPVLSIPRNGFMAEATVWNQAGQWDAFVEIDGSFRTEAPLVVGEKTFLPYNLGVVVSAVTTWNPATAEVVQVPTTSWTYTTTAGVVLSGYPLGTGYVATYTAQPVYVAEKAAGGVAHNRPFGLGSQNLPKKFRLQALDVWSRAQQQGDGPLTP